MSFTPVRRATAAIVFLFCLAPAQAAFATTTCELYPIALPEQVLAPLAPGAVVNEMPRGTGAGNFSWLSWTGANDAPTLAASLQVPGNSQTYVNPDQPDDHLLHLGDYAQGGARCDGHPAHARQIASCSAPIPRCRNSASSE